MFFLYIFSFQGDLSKVSGISCFKCDNCPDPWNSNADNVVRRDCPQSDSLCIVSNIVTMFKKYMRAIFSIWLSNLEICQIFLIKFEKPICKSHHIQTFDTDY